MFSFRRTTAAAAVAEASGFLHGRRKPFSWQQTFNLVNVKLKWVKDPTLDAVVSNQGDLKPVCFLISIIANHPLSLHSLTKHHGQLGLPRDLKLATFIRRYPTVFREFRNGGSIPWFGLTPEASDLHEEERGVTSRIREDLVDRLAKLLMLTEEKTLPLQTIDQLKWDMGLPYEYNSFVMEHHSTWFGSIRLPDDRSGLKLLQWEGCPVPQLQKNAPSEEMETGCLSFPVRFTRGFGLKRKCSSWLEEWQKLPYTSPYVDPSHLDVRTDVSEKRIVGVFHELLHLTLEKMTERKNVSNLRRALRLPQKFTRVFERHPGIFYISRKCGTQTVVLREGYESGRLVEKHPLVEVREEYGRLMRRGVLERSMGLWKKSDESIVEGEMQ